ncbi:DUF6090 family protein [Catalinimonas sp. 4WD22]|uniref:DUF6090 family protein n=1 Tax=Catalinimonas locisalis TaxID=3133978 RepID=UPI00310163F6
MLKFLKSVHWADKLVDVFVVVLSISIAFWLNNWRENSSNTLKEKKYLLNLSEDLAKDSIELAFKQKNIKDVFEKIQRIQYLTSIQSKVDSIPIYMGYALNYDYFIFHPEDYTYKTLQQSGDISLIKSDTIRQTLSHLYDNYQMMDLLKDAGYFYQTDLILPFNNNYDLRTGKIIDPKVYQSPEFFNMIIYYRNTFGNYVDVTNNTFNKVCSLKKLIREELEE